MKTFATICVMCFLIARAVFGADSSAQAEKLLESARHKEVMEGDLKGAVDQYRKIASQFAKQPEIAARALFQLGQCQEKLGQAEARKSYERIVREYGGAGQYASAARARLAALGGDAAPGPLATRVVWTGPKVEGYESGLSPDGRFITFPDWDTGNLGLHDFVTGADRLLTNTATWKPADTAFAESSAISRDGKQVAYSWFDKKLGDRYELRVLNLNGEPNPRRVFGPTNIHFIEPRDWSPDGKWIAVYLDGPGHPSIKRREIGLIGAQDGTLRLLKSGTDDITMWGFSPDGRYLAYTRGRPVSQGNIISSDGKSDVPILSGTSSVESPVWTPDGSRIVFASDRSGSTGLWSIRVTDGKPVGEPELLKADFNNAQAVRFARDGALFYAVKLRQNDVYVAGLDPVTGRLTSEPKRVNQRAIGNSWGRVAWVPGSRSLSFWSKHQERQSLMVHELATGDERELWFQGGPPPEGPGYTGWFPDGRSLMSWQKKDKTLVFRRIDSRTGEAQATWTVPELPAGSNGFNCSPDLMTTYLLQKDPTVPCEGSKCTHIMLARDLETGRDREVLRIKAAGVRNPSISPDGRDIAVITSDGDGVWSVLVAPTAGGPPRELYRVTDGNLSPAAWTHDGSHVLAFHQALGGKELWSFPTKGGAPERSPMSIRVFSAPAVSPDGTQIAFDGGSNKEEMWVMTGLFHDTKPAR